MEIGVKVGDIMTRELVSVKPDLSIIDCARKMEKHDIGMVIVKGNGKLLGMLTEKDIIWALTKKSNLKSVKARDLMIRKVPTIKPSKDIYEALLRMRNLKIKWLPVTVRKYVIGMLTIKDILKIEPSLFEIAVQHHNMNHIHINEDGGKLMRKNAILSGKGLWIKEGVCEECGAFGLLQNIDGFLFCEGCSLTGPRLH